MTRHVLVTGAASGIGLAVAQRFASLGDRLTLVDHRADALAAAAGSIGPTPVGTVVADLRDPDAPTRAVSTAWEQAPVDVLVNAAGVYPATPFLELDAATWDSVQDVNVRAPLLATVALAQLATAAGRTPTVVNITSGAALRARPGAAPYSTSKAALEMVTRASALELGAAGIRVNAVSPGFVVVDSAVNRVSDEYAAAVSPNPLGRPGEPSDIAKAVVWLADPEQSGWVTGTVLRVDGGSSTGAHTLPLSTAREEVTA
ncbi:SDR family oxidoreductase [Curtobacterium sp. PhB136]|uniref:SDR family NAD(P)-dependent oxidoreductase n=1 Tax=Curtobacterium sp. PhB136 TaxID=2485181 RepID=UPI001048C97D|nr:SDR family oxidoreductase [Curtobacterium sp. PhB136]TCK62893.1 NAD(P)-dependent dehydrogenase (short-subunit alcohol dehydrogenase family) [Curtobacterium sp. PhB136]